MDTRNQLLVELKQNGPCSIKDLIAQLGISENAVRHHLNQLKQDGFIEEIIARRGIGRPAITYDLTLAAEGQFPKRYNELLELVLNQAEAFGNLELLLDNVASQLAKQITPSLEGLPPEARLQTLMEHLDYGDMLGHFSKTATSWEFKAYNCIYRDTGCKFEAVCNLLPAVIRRATQLEAERVICQRDGERYCHFAGGLI